MSKQQSTVKAETGAIVKRINRELATGEPPPGRPEMDAQFDRVLHAEIKDFDDVRALTWFAHQQMMLAFDIGDNMFCLLALQRAKEAIARVANEMGVLYAPPLKGECASPTECNRGPLSPGHTLNLRA